MKELVAAGMFLDDATLERVIKEYRGMKRLSGSTPRLDMTQPADQWVRTRTTLVHQPSLGFARALDVKADQVQAGGGTPEERQYEFLVEATPASARPRRRSFCGPVAHRVRLVVRDLRSTRS